MKRILTALLIASLCIMPLAACGTASTTAPQAPDVTVDQIVEAFKARIIADLEKEGIAKDEVFGPGEGEPGLFITEDLKKPAAERMLAADIDSADLKDGFGIKASFMVKSDLILILEAASADKVSGLIEKLNAILDAEKELWSSYLPDQYEFVKNTVIKTQGNFIVYITYRNADALETIFDSLFAA